MHRLKPDRQADAFTMVELLVVIAIIGILAALLLPAVTNSKNRAKQIVCENDLRQIGIAFQIFSHDHNSRFPMQVSTNDGGSLEYVLDNQLLNGPFDYRHFQSLASGLENSAVLACPADTRSAAVDFASLQNSNVSYFVGAESVYDQPMSVLAGDGNLAATTVIVHVTTGERLTWTKAVHMYKGNVLFADAHIEEWRDNGGSVLASSGDLILPTDSGSGGGGTGGGGGGGSGGGGTGGGGGGGGGGGTGGGGGGGGSGGGGGGGGTGGGSSGGSGGGTSPGQTVNPGNNANPVLISNSVVVQMPISANSPSHQPQPPSQPPMAALTSSGLKDVAPRTAARSQNQADISNSVAAESVVTTNPPAAKISSPQNDDGPAMSPTNRKVAKVLGTFLGGTYLLILLLILAYIAYRIWRWRQDAIRQRQRKMAQRGVRFDPES